MMKDKLYLGTGGNVRPLRNRVWKLPFLIGLGLLVIYFIYEVIKIGFSITADMTIHADYLGGLLVMNAMNLMVPIISIVSIAMIAMVLLRAMSYSVKSTRTTRILIVVLAIPY